MKVILFGATGMVGQGVLRQCLRDPNVESVLTIGRTPTGVNHRKLRDLIRPDLFHYADLADDFAAFDACFFTLGVTAAGKSEPEYARITYDLTIAAARALADANPRMIFIYVSGLGTDTGEQGRVMWARIKGRTENALLRLPFTAYAFRPGVIEPSHGESSKTTSYRILYTLTKPVLSALRRALPNHILTTEQIAHAMLNVARYGAKKRILEPRDIRALA
jgi:uncharacterized protein YbjT (DUF2867 family)